MGVTPGETGAIDAAVPASATTDSAMAHDAVVEAVVWNSCTDMTWPSRASTNTVQDWVPDRAMNADDE